MIFVVAEWTMHHATGLEVWMTPLGPLMLGTTGCSNLSSGLRVGLFGKPSTSQQIFANRNKRKKRKKERKKEREERNAWEDGEPCLISVGVRLGIAKHGQKGGDYPSSTATRRSVSSCGIFIADLQLQNHENSRMHMPDAAADTVEEDVDRPASSETGNVLCLKRHRRGGVVCTAGAAGGALSATCRP